MNRKAVYIFALFSIFYLVAIDGVWAKKVFKIDLMGVKQPETMYIFSRFMDDYDNKMLLGLSPKEIRLTIDNKPVLLNKIKIVPFKNNKKFKVAVGILLVNYANFNEIIGGLKDSIKTFIQGITDQSLVGVWTYNIRPVQVVSFTKDRSDAANQVDSIKKSDKVTPYLLQSIKIVSQKMAEDDSLPDRKILVVISDGIDIFISGKESRKADAHLKDIFTTCTETSKIQIMSVAITMDIKDGFKALNNLSRKSNGTFRTVTNVNEMDEKLNDIAREINELYVISGDLPYKYWDGEKHSFAVGVNTKDGVIFSDPVERRPKKISIIVRIWGSFGTLFIIVILLIGAIIGLYFLIGWLRKRPKKVKAVAVKEVKKLCPQCKKPMEPDWKECKNCMSGTILAKLEVVGGPMNGTTYVIKDEITTIGLMEGNNITITDESVSKKHAGIKMDGGRFEFADLGSTNGSFINGKRVTKQFLKAGDRIKLGNTEMLFKLSK